MGLINIYQLSMDLCLALYYLLKIKINIDIHSEIYQDFTFHTDVFFFFWVLTILFIFYASILLK